MFNCKSFWQFKMLLSFWNVYQYGYATGVLVFDFFLSFVTLFNQITTNSEMNDFFLSLSACSCIYIVSQYIAQINKTRHLCKQRMEGRRERPFIRFDDKLVAPEIQGTMKLAELLWPFQSKDMGLDHRKIINSQSFYQCVRMLTSRTSRYIG